MLRHSREGRRTVCWSPCSCSPMWGPGNQTKIVRLGDRFHPRWDASLAPSLAPCFDFCSRECGRQMQRRENGSGFEWSSIWECSGRNRADPSSSSRSLRSVCSARRLRKGQGVVTANQEFPIKFGKPVQNKSQSEAAGGQRCRVHCCGRGSAGPGVLSDWKCHPITPALRRGSS